MYKITFPQKDATIYEKYPTLNSGIDQINQENHILRVHRLKHHVL